MHGDIHVVKLGGSLLDLSDLPERLIDYRTRELGDRALLVVGGGEPAEAVRRFDRTHGLDETSGHWLAVRAMQLNALMLAEVLDRAGLELRMVHSPEACAGAWAAGQALAMMEPVAWLEAMEAAGHVIPHRWAFTSDSIAAHAARVLGASRLTLLKSTLPKLPDGMAATRREASEAGVVDEAFPEAASGVPHVEVVNLRGARTPNHADDAWPRCVLAC